MNITEKIKLYLKDHPGIWFPQNILAALVAAKFNLARLSVKNALACSPLSFKTKNAVCDRCGRTHKAYKMKEEKDGDRNISGEVLHNVGPSHPNS